ncbi:MAG: cbb3-type cytochrome c oxidase subunit II [Limisphaerales bacterium]
MKHGAYIFLASFLALSASWCGLVLVPQLQLGRQSLSPITGTTDQYPQRRPGLAEQGLQVYRAHGCATCHSQQTRQTGTVFDVVLNELGTNETAVALALAVLKVDWKPADLQALPREVFRGVNFAEADAAERTLKPTGAKFSVQVRAVGPDIERGWGLRGSVAADYLQDHPVLLGSQRLGPDLANIGLRQPDLRWHLNHLYAPASTVPGSTMPPYRFLFETRPVGSQPSPLALQLPAEFAPPTGYEVVPTDDALALAAYLVSLRASVPLFEAPVTVALPASSAPAP